MMATMQVDTKLVEVIVKEPRSVVTLTLSAEEAVTLGSILNGIGGSPSHSLRKYADSIREALCVDDWGSGLGFDEYSESISFKDFSNTSETFMTAVRNFKFLTVFEKV